LHNENGMQRLQAHAESEILKLRAVLLQIDIAGDAMPAYAFQVGVNLASVADRKSKGRSVPEACQALLAVTKAKRRRRM
jgi:hypothetical protein